MYAWIFGALLFLSVTFITLDKINHARWRAHMRRLREREFAEAREQQEAR